LEALLKILVNLEVGSFDYPDGRKTPCLQIRDLPEGGRKAEVMDPTLVTTRIPRPS
jgi:hypothetical protein